MTFPKNGAVGGVTNKRLILWESSAMGKPKDVFPAVPLTEIDSVYDRDVGQKLLRGAPASRVILLVFNDETALPMWATTTAPKGEMGRRLRYSLTDCGRGDIADPRSRQNP